MGRPADGIVLGPRNGQGMDRYRNTRRRWHRGTYVGEYAVVVLVLAAGAIVLATGQPAGIGWALVLCALAMIVSSSSDRGGGRGRR
jgi:hypothetical protein